MSSTGGRWRREPSLRTRGLRPQLAACIPGCLHRHTLEECRGTAATSKLLRGRELFEDGHTHVGDTVDCIAGGPEVSRVRTELSRRAPALRNPANAC